MKKFVNFRPLFLIFLTFLCSIFSIVELFLNNIVPIIIFGTIFFVCITLFIICIFKNTFLKIFFQKFGIKNARIFLLMIIVSAILSSGLSAYSFLHFSRRGLKNGTYAISATICEIVKNDEKTSLLLKDIVVDGKNYSFSINATVDSANYDFTVGDKISFSAYCYASKLVQNGQLKTNLLKTDTRYYCNFDLSDCTIEKGNTFFVYKIKEKIKTILIQNMSEDNAGFSYAVLCGDKSILSDEYYLVFKESGLAHLLAVSGLHIGFLVGFLVFLLKKLKINPKIQFIIIFFVLLIYNIICNFSPSIFRSSVMSLCLIFGLLIGERNDIISSLSLAGIIVLITQPLYLFDIGFLLSFGSVFGIAFFAKSFTSLFKKIKFPKILSESFAVTISASIGIFPWVCKFFGEFAPISLINNLIVLPIFSVMYVILFVCTLINLIFPFVPILYFSQFFVNIVLTLSTFFSKFGTIKTIDFDIFSIFIFYVICFFVSQFFMLKVKSKVIICLAMTNLFLPVLATCNLPKYYNYDSFAICGEVSASTLFTTKDNKKILVNIDDNLYRIKNIEYLFSTMKIKNIDAVCLLNYQASYQDNVCTIAKNYGVKDIIVFGEYDSSTKLGLANSLYSTSILKFFSDSTCNVFENFSLNIIYQGSICKAVKFSVDDKNVLQIYSALSSTQISTINQLFTNKICDYVVSNKFLERYKTIPAKNYICYKTDINFDELSCIGLDEYWTINLACDTI